MNLKGNAEMTDLFRCKKEGTECCAPKSKILEYQGLIQRNDSYPVFVNSQSQPHLPQYLPNYPQNAYQQIPPNMYAPASVQVPVQVQNPYQQYQPQQAIPNNYAVPPATNYITQPQPVPQQSIAASNYAAAAAVVSPQNYGPVPQTVPYSPNVIQNQPHLNLSPAYSTPGKLFFSFSKKKNMYQKFRRKKPKTFLIQFSDYTFISSNAATDITTYNNYHNNIKSSRLFEICVRS